MSQEAEPQGMKAQDAGAGWEAAGGRAPGGWFCSASYVILYIYGYQPEPGLGKSLD